MLASIWCIRTNIQRIMEPNNVSYYPKQDPAANQLGEFAKTHKDPKVKNMLKYANVRN